MIVNINNLVYVGINL